MLSDLCDPYQRYHLEVLLFRDVSAVNIKKDLVNIDRWNRLVKDSHDLTDSKQVHGKSETGLRECIQAPTLWTAPRAGLSPDTPIIFGIDLWPLFSYRFSSSSA